MPVSGSYQKSEIYASKLVSNAGPLLLWSVTAFGLGFVILITDPRLVNSAVQRFGTTVLIMYFCLHSILHSYQNYAKWANYFKVVKQFSKSESFIRFTISAWSVSFVAGACFLAHLCGFSQSISMASLSRSILALCLSMLCALTVTQFLYLEKLEDDGLSLSKQTEQEVADKDNNYKYSFLYPPPPST
jgi:hypothetical protein